MEAQPRRHEPLYLKHRPQALDQLVGQESVRRTLTNAIQFNRLAHAYLFTGPRGTGKTSTARILAKSLNCKSGAAATVTPCQECVSCLEITNGNSCAVLEIDAASNNSVDDARILIERAPLVAPGGRYKIYIIDECHMLTKEAFNALLKTIEDPPPNVVFILATTEEHKVIPTIISRCQRLMFRLVRHEELLAHLIKVAQLEDIEITVPALDFLARRAGGGLRDALGLLDQSSLLCAPGQPVDISDLLALLGALQEDVLLSMSAAVLHRQGQELLTAANKLLHEGREPATIVQELARHFLNLAKASYLGDTTVSVDTSCHLIIGSSDYLKELSQQAPLFERSELSQLVELLDRLEQTCRRSTQPAMHLEVGLLGLCHRQDMLLVRDLSARIARLESWLSAEQTALPASLTRERSTRQHSIGQTQRPMLELTQGSSAAMSNTANRESSPEARSVPANVPIICSPESTGAVQNSATTSSPVPATAPSSPHLASTLDNSEDNPMDERRPADDTQPDPKGSGVNLRLGGPLSSLTGAEEHEPGRQPIVLAPSTSASSGTGESLSSSAGNQSLLTAPAATEALEAIEEDSPLADDEVDRVWSDMLVELQRRHIPTFSLMSTHGFPILLTAKQLTIGVTTEGFQKTLESRIGYVKLACSQVLDKPVLVKIKVVNKEFGTTKPQAAPRERALSAAPSSGKAQGPDEDEGSEQQGPISRRPPYSLSQAPVQQDEPYGQLNNASPSASSVAFRNARPQDNALLATSYDQEPVSDEASPELTEPQSASPTNTSERAVPKADELSAQTSNNTFTIVKEAYKLFEGPGSRLLGN